MRYRKTKTEQLQEIAEEYRLSGEEWPASARMIAAWALRKKLWAPQHSSLISQCTKEFSHALREEYLTDPQGRRVRVMHAFREDRELPSGEHVQLTLWVNILDAKPEQMQAAFQQRRLQILGDCKQLKTDVDSYNENSHGHIQMEFDFSVDLLELEQPAEYVADIA